MSKVCPRCGCLDIEKEPDDWYNEDLVTCMRCDMIFPRAELADATIFQYLTQSTEVLAPLLVREYWMADGPHIVKMWVSKIVPDHKYKTEAEAISATVVKLKEVYNETVLERLD